MKCTDTGSPVTPIDSKRRPLYAPIDELLDAAAEMLDIVGMPALAIAVREARRQHGTLPGNVKAALGDYELVEGCDDVRRDRADTRSLHTSVQRVLGYAELSCYAPVVHAERSKPFVIDAERFGLAHRLGLVVFLEE
jgi:hypothetical protein